MAIGDKAAAKGLAVYAPTQDRRLGYQNDNQRGDELADEIDARVKADSDAATKAATDLATKLDATKLRVQQVDPGAVPDGTVWISWT